MGRTGRVRYPLFTQLDIGGVRSLYVHAPKTRKSTHEHDHHSWSQTSYTAPPTTKIGGRTPNTYTNLFERHRHGGGHVQEHLGCSGHDLGILAVCVLLNGILVHDLYWGYHGHQRTSDRPPL